MEQQEAVDDTTAAAVTRLARRWRPLPLPPSRRAGKGVLENRPLPRGRRPGWAGSAAGRMTRLPSLGGPRRSECPRYPQTLGQSGEVQGHAVQGHAMQRQAAEYDVVAVFFYRGVLDAEGK